MTVVGRTRRDGGAWLAGALLIAALYPSNAFGQAMPATGFQPIFGGTELARPLEQHIDAMVTVVAAGDSDVATAEAAGVLTPVSASMPERRGFYTELNPQLMAGWRKPHLQFNVTAGSDVRGYGNFNDVLVMSHAGQLNLSGQLGRGTTFAVNEGVTYAPAFLYGVFSVVPSAVESTVSSSVSNNTFDNERSYSSGTNATITHSLTARTTLSFNSDLQYTTFRGNVPGYSDMHSYHAGSRLSHGLSRNTHFLLGYRFGDGQYLGQPSTTTEHNIEIGFNHSRALSATRQATFAFTVGSSITKGPLLGEAVTQIGEQYHLTGSASYTRQVSRTWSVLGSYQRGLNYIQGLPQPVFTDAVTASTHGFLARRTDLLVSAAYSLGDAGPTLQSPFSTYTGDIRVRTGLSRSLAIYTEYLYYFYDFSGTFALPPNVPSRFGRNGVRVGVSAWVPVMQR